MKLANKLSITLAGAALAATTVLGSAGATGTNLLTNGQLMGSTDGWTAEGAGEFSVRPDIGAEIWAVEETLLKPYTYAYQCIEIDDTQRHQFEGDIRAIPGPRTGEAYFALHFIGGDNCEGFAVQSKLSERFTAEDGWQHVSMELERTNPQAARSLLVMMVAEKQPTKRPELKNQPFAAQFRLLEVTASAADTDEPVQDAEPVAYTSEPKDTGAEGAENSSQAVAEDSSGVSTPVLAAGGFTALLAAMGLGFAFTKPRRG